MKCSVQLFELILCIETKAFDNQLNRAYERAMRKGRSMDEINFDHADETLGKKGIIVAFHDDKKKKIKLIIYPGLIIGDDPNELWEPSADNISELRDILDKQIAAYFHRDYGLNNFKLSRVTIAADIDIASPSKASGYIKILHNLGRVKCFSQLERDKDNDNEKINKERVLR